MPGFPNAAGPSAQPNAVADGHRISFENYGCGRDKDPWAIIRLDRPDSCIETLVGGDDIVITQTRIRIEVDYPLDEEKVVEVTAASSRGFTRGELAQAVVDTYHSIYAIEEATSDVPVGNVPGLQNRSITNGTFGISAHGLDDLVLHRVSYDAARDLWTLGIDS
mmetsp:Transcript_20104/g.60694  ORF Transcript_20104/g.60694 Transcript_20104/m.60694 type:complete len:164 (+) Transcript_20104:128-619(+)